MERETGTLVRWDEEKGYGFIRPYNNKDEIFFHVKTLAPHQRRPKVGDVLTYDVMLDEQDRYYAGATKIEGFAWSGFTFIWLGIVVLFGIYAYFAIQRTLPFHPIAIYVAMSLLAIWTYRGDKWAAQAGDWRTPELRLHLVETLGGWPGAFFAQIFYRHKIKKVKYQVVFWLIVAGHGALWYYVFTHPAQYASYKQTVNTGLQTVFQKINGAPEHPEQRPAAPRPATPVPPTRRSIATPARNARILAGIVKEVRPDEGVIVSLQTDTGSEGIIPKSTLIPNFVQHFRIGEKLQVAIQTITIADDQKRIELILVEQAER